MIRNQYFCLLALGAKIKAVMEAVCWQHFRLLNQITFIDPFNVKYPSFLIYGVIKTVHDKQKTKKTRIKPRFLITKSYSSIPDFFQQRKGLNSYSFSV